MYSLKNTYQDISRVLSAGKKAFVIKVTGSLMLVDEKLVNCNVHIGKCEPVIPIVKDWLFFSDYDGNNFQVEWKDKEDFVKQPYFNGWLKFTDYSDKYFLADVKTDQKRESALVSILEKQVLWKAGFLLRGTLMTDDKIYGFENRDSKNLISIMISNGQVAWKKQFNKELNRVVGVSPRNEIIVFTKDNSLLFIDSENGNLVKSIDQNLSHAGNYSVSHENQFLYLIGKQFTHIDLVRREVVYDEPINIKNPDLEGFLILNVSKSLFGKYITFRAAGKDEGFSHYTGIISVESGKVEWLYRLKDENRQRFIPAGYIPQIFENKLFFLDSLNTLYLFEKHQINENYRIQR